ncbi:MAG TPA: hypothetical protein PKX39_04430, partial [Flavobacteriales bacterium]|nr:hypothetical protein [Flavobacteriales bacterium]
MYTGPFYRIPGRLARKADILTLPRIQFSGPDHGQGETRETTCPTGQEKESGRIRHQGEGFLQEQEKRDRSQGEVGGCEEEVHPGREGQGDSGENEVQVERIHLIKSCCQSQDQVEWSSPGGETPCRTGIKREASTTEQAGDPKRTGQTHQAWKPTRDPEDAANQGPGSGQDSEGPEHTSQADSEARGHEHSAGRSTIAKETGRTARSWRGK